MSCTYRMVKVLGQQDKLFCAQHNKPSKYDLVTSPTAPCMAVDPLTDAEVESMSEGFVPLVYEEPETGWNAFQHLDSQAAGVETITTNPVEGITYTRWRNGRPGARPVNVFVDDENPNPPEE